MQFKITRTFDITQNYGAPDPHPIGGKYDLKLKVVCREDYEDFGAIALDEVKAVGTLVGWGNVCGARSAYAHLEVDAPDPGEGMMYI